MEAPQPAAPRPPPTIHHTTPPSTAVHIEHGSQIDRRRHFECLCGIFTADDVDSIGAEQNVWSEPNITLGQNRTDLFPTAFAIQLHLAVFGVLLRPCVRVCFSFARAVSTLRRQFRYYTHAPTQTHTLRPTPVSERGCDNNLYTETNPYNKWRAPPTVFKHNCAFISWTDRHTHTLGTTWYQP